MIQYGTCVANLPRAPRLYITGSRVGGMADIRVHGIYPVIGHKDPGAGGRRRWLGWCRPAASSPGREGG